jgi:polar amino acid transport system substrate-binding protein
MAADKGAPGFFAKGLTVPMAAPCTVRVLAAVLAALAIWAPAAGAAEPLLMLFRDKPPYSYLENGVYKGALLKKTERVLARARIEAKFAVLPPKRIFKEIEDNAAPVCSFGWYKIAEREKYARFSAVLQQDRPHLVLVNAASAKKLRRHKSLKAVMSDPSLTLAVAGGVSYGPELDAMIEKFPGEVDRALIPPVLVAKKVANGRADFMFFDQEDYDYLIEKDPQFRESGMLSVRYPDRPAGLKRYIICSRQVSEDTMRKINAAIAAEAAH